VGLGLSTGLGSTADGFEGMVGQHTLLEDQLIDLMLGAANRDQNDFDMERKPSRHVAIERGIRFCVGTPPSRLEARNAFPNLLVLPDLRLAVDRAEWTASVTHLDQESLPVSFDA
jgi:cytochrome P450